MLCICGKEIVEYEVEEYIEELNGRNKNYCKECREIFRSKIKKSDIDNNSIEKVPIKYSYCYLPGFEYSEKFNCWVKKDEPK